MKLQLRYSEVLQGEFRLERLNLLLAFQVNCPGCFLSALPLAQTLYRQKGLNVLALSTAFEDFELNTSQNTRLLLDKREVVGETRRILESYGWQKYPNPLDFPVLFDEMVNLKKFAAESQLEEMIKLQDISGAKKERLKAEICGYPNGFAKIPFTFTANRFAGTPTWVIFDENYEISAQWFGHKSLEETEWLIKSRQK